MLHCLFSRGLLTSVQHCADWVLSFEKQQPILKCFKSLESIFKLIIQSRLLFSRASCGQLEDSFRRDLNLVFISLNTMLGLTQTAIINSQIELLMNIGVVFEQLVDILPILEVTKLANTMLDAPRDGEAQLTKAKLFFMKTLMQGKLFHDDGTLNEYIN